MFRSENAQFNLVGWFKSNVTRGTWDYRGNALRVCVGVFLRDPNSYLREFRKKPRKIPNDKVDECDR